MKRVLSLVLLIALMSTIVFSSAIVQAEASDDPSRSFAAAETSEQSFGSVHTFAYYKTPNAVYDAFLQNITDIEYLKTNSEYCEITEFNRVFVSYGQYPHTTLNGDAAEYLSVRENFFDTMRSVGLTGEIYDYTIFTTPYIDFAANMPMSVWMNTSEGVKFATIIRTGDDNPNFFDLFRINIYTPDEYVKKFGEHSGKAVILGEEKNFSYVKIRNEGAEIGLRELMEDLGISIEWNEDDESITLMCPEDINPNWGINLQIGEYSEQDGAFHASETLIRPGTDRDGEQSEFLVKMIDDRTVINNRTACYLLDWLLRQNYEDPIHESSVDNEKSVVEIYSLFAIY